MRSMTIVALLGATALSCNGAMAQGCGQQRGRLAVIPYEPMTIYECTTSPDVATSIIASSGEKMGPAGAPDTSSLDIQEKDNMLTINAKPDEVGRTPNVTFITHTPDGQTRPYYFLFHVVQSGGVAAIQLTYPEDDAKAKKALAAERQEATRNDLIHSKLRTALFSGRANWQYDCRCDAGQNLKPEIWDNGTETTLRYVGNTPSAITIARLDRDGTEKSPDEVPHLATTVNFTPISGPNGDLLVIPDVVRVVKPTQLPHSPLRTMTTPSQQPKVAEK